MFFLTILFISFGLGSAKDATADLQKEGVDGGRFAQFEIQLEEMRQALMIPGMSAAIVQDQELVWAKGFGYADLENQIEATPDTPYHLASVTKPIAATIIMQLVEEGLLDLDDPVEKYGVHLESQGVIRVRHLLTHTSEGVPGSHHDYNGNRYIMLGKVIEGASGKSFAELLTERILIPQGMTSTAPNPAWGVAGFLASQGLGGNYDQFPKVYQELARPYQFDESLNTVPGSYSLHFSPAAGLLSSVVDLAKFDIALDQDRFLRPETKEEMFSPIVSTFQQNPDLMYGLGWYSQNYHGTRIIWHSGGWPPSVSSLYMKVPDENLTFIILANSYYLNLPYPLGEGDVLFTTYGLAFYKRFVFPAQTGETIPDIDWQASVNDMVGQLKAAVNENTADLLERELWSYRKLFASVGRMENASRLLFARNRVFLNSTLLRDLPIAQWASDGVPTYSPVKSLSPEDIVIYGRGVLIWLILVFLSLIYLFWKFFDGTLTPWWSKLVWVITTGIFGPVGLFAYLVSIRGLGGRTLFSTWRRALGSALFSATGNAVGIIILIWYYVNFMPDKDLGPDLLIVPFLIGWLFFRVPLAVVLTRKGYFHELRRIFFAEAISTSLMIISSFLVVYFIENRWLLDVMPQSPFFWCMVSLGMLIGTIVIYPFHFWLANKRTFPWPGQTSDWISSSEDDIILEMVK